MSLEKIDKIKSKMQKLLNHAASAEKIGNKAEASAFMKKLQSLCLEHKLSLASIQAHDPDNLDESIGYEEVDRAEHGLPVLKRASKWIWDLARVIARANNCRHLVMNGSNKIWFVGRDQDRRFAIHMFAYCYKSLLIDCVKENNKTYDHFYAMGCPEQAHGFAASFRTGFVSAVRDRLEEAREDIRKTTDEKTFALITVEPMELVHKWMGEYTTGTATSLGGSSSYNEHGYSSGRESGGRVSLATGSVTSGKPKQLGGK
tara:strand:+ start:12930 stop:13706 length:777 start_codon:yes stop_codon:yes gene_type:complete